MKPIYAIPRKIMLYAAIIILGVLPINNISYAQSDFDTKGKDFWLTFLPNFHSNTNSERIYIFITCEKATKGTIYYKDQFGADYQVPFEINNPDDVYDFALNYNGFELNGAYYPEGAGTPIRYDSEEITEKSFHIVSDDDITVYAHSEASLTSEAFLILPTDVLDKDYLVMSYNSDGRLSTSASNNRTTPSQFAIVAVEDSTIVTINPSVHTLYNGMNEQEFRLDQGEVYLVQTDIDDNNLRPDLTGSQVSSTKPIALFSGQQRSTIPVGTSGEQSSRDVLIEQMPPVSTWGNNAFVIPFVQAPNTGAEGYDLYRILASENNTEVYIDGTFIKSLNKGEFIERELNSASYVNANNPVLVAEYKKSGSVDPDVKRDSDPLMVVMPPKEQFMKAYQVINLQVNNRYTEQYISIIVPDEHTNSTQIDGSNIAPGDFISISGSGYSYAHLTVTDGVHKLNSDGEFGIIIYGYGYAVSYGYIGGMSLKRIDLAPQIFTEDSCYKISGLAVDSTGDIQGLQQVKSVPEYENNVDVVIDNYSVNDRVVTFSAELQNQYKDGSFKISAADPAGNVSEQGLDIPGMTLAVDGYEDTDELPVYYYYVDYGTDFNFDVEIENYGKFEREITNAYVDNDELFTVNFSGPLAVAAGTNESINISFYSEKGLNHYDTLTIETECGTRNVAAIHITQSLCHESAFIYENFIDADEMEYVNNARISGDRLRLTHSTSHLSGAAWHSNYVPVKNGFETTFSFSILEGNNNNADENSLPGGDGLAFVVQAESNDLVGVAGGSIGYGGLYNSLAVEFDLFQNDQTQIINFHDPDGNHIAVQSNGPGKNIASHIEPYLLGIEEDIPVIYPTGSVYYVKILYDDAEERLDIYMDTQGNFTAPVLTVSPINLSALLDLHQEEWAYVGFTAATGTTFEIHDILSWYFCPDTTSAILVSVEEEQNNEYGISVYPNPGSNQINIEFYNPEPGNVKIDIFNTLGAVRETVINSVEPEGMKHILWNTSSYGSGTYICRIMAGRKVYIKKVVINNE